MPRYARIVIPEIAHHITQRGNNRQVVFEEDIDYLKYCYWISKYSALNNLEILAYCLMKNHVHFIVIPKDAKSISRTFQLTHMRHAQYMHQKRGSSGHLWQGRFYSCLLDDRHMYQAVRYVERNPVRCQSVKDAWEYRWSSAKWHVGSGGKSSIYLKDATILSQDNWKEYLSDEDREFEKCLRAKTHKGLAVGDPEFIAEIERKTGRVLRSIKPGKKPDGAIK